MSDNNLWWFLLACFLVGSISGGLWKISFLLLRIAVALED